VEVLFFSQRFGERRPGVFAIADVEFTLAKPGAQAGYVVYDK
jgi:hypothetical protein